MHRFEADRDYLLGMYCGIESLIIIRGWQRLPSSQRRADILLLTRRRRPPSASVGHLCYPPSPLKAVIFSISECYASVINCAYARCSLRFKHGSSLKTSLLLYPELCHILFEIEDDVNSLNKEGGSSAASEHVNLNAGYDSSFEDGSSKEPNVARGRRKKKSKKDSELGELEETIKNAISNIAAQENQGPTMDECHEKLKSMRLKPDDPVYLAATGIFCQSKSYREAWMLLPSIPNVLKKWIEMMARQMGF
ncbi:hypothetical protein Tco_0488160 [Tanacetum coccineum]